LYILIAMPERNGTDYEIFQVNAFAEGTYTGNPAGVCLLTSERDEEFYRTTAARMGLSETAFVYKKENGYRLRWFSPNGTEVDLCGHATLATAFILYNKGREDKKSTILFFTKSGPLTAEADGKLVCLNFPAEEIFGLNGDVYGIDTALGARSTYTGRTRFDAFIELDSVDTVIKLKPDFEKLKSLPGRGVIVTARAMDRKYDFVSRFFCPKLGMNEDPVTGSAHCALAVYWGHLLRKDSMVGYQASPRGGIVRVGLAKDRVLIRGAAVEVPVTQI
jgi:PhzF family phenazine biosynthesis protein